MLENRYAELKDFLRTIDCVKEFLESRLSGPIQNVPESCAAYEIGCRIRLPLPFGKSNLANQIMEKVGRWAQECGLERFGYVAPGDCPLLFLGLRELSAASQEADFLFE